MSCRRAIFVFWLEGLAGQLAEKNTLVAKKSCIFSSSRNSRSVRGLECDVRFGFLRHEDPSELVTLTLNQTVRVLSFARPRRYRQILSRQQERLGHCMCARKPFYGIKEMSEKRHLLGTQPIESSSLSKRQSFIHTAVQVCSLESGGLSKIKCK